MRFHDLFVSGHKDLFGTLSGGITATLVQGIWRIAGTITVDKAHLDSNLLSSQVQHDLLSASQASYGKNIDLDLTLNTISPLQVKTAFLEAQARVVATLKGTATRPKTVGSIELEKGSFAFPYKPLYVTHGKLILSEHQPDDPMIELTAKNKIKKHTITMHVTGSIQRPKISFEAVPHLAEENILTLLLSGTEDGPFYLAMPNIVMMNIESLLFGSGENLTKAQQFFKTLLKPLKNVRILPVLSDQQGKRLQGAIEVDINDRLRAKAQNNLDLSDETQVEVEYALSDDVSVKAVRDETGSLGGELEMRWKF